MSIFAGTAQGVIKYNCVASRTVVAERGRSITRHYLIPLSTANQSLKWFSVIK